MDMIRFTPTGSTVAINTIVTNVNFGINGKMALAAKGETTKAASYQSPSGFTSAQQQQIERLQQLSHEAIETAVDNATSQITGGTGDSYVHFIYDDTTGGLQEIVVSNETDYTLSNAKVWRWNSRGLGFSSTGYAGPYDLALTQDGSIVATLITTGTLNANLIKAGIISDMQNKNSWNLSTGEINMTEGSINIGNGAFEVTSDGELTANEAMINGSIKSTNPLINNRFIELDSGGIAGGENNTQYGEIFFENNYDLLGYNSPTLRLQAQHIIFDASSSIGVIDGSSMSIFKGYTGEFTIQGTSGGFHFVFVNGLLVTTY
jgi:hypothetical protein